MNPSSPARPNSKPGPKKELRRILSKLGVASRTQADALITGGRVKVNGQVIRDPARAFDGERAKIQIDHETQQKPERRLYLFHKPKGIVTTRSDEKGRKTVFDVVGELLGAEARGIHAVGRLDMATTGLLILTNDTQYSAFLTDPTNQIEREYVVTVQGKFDPERLVAGQKLEVEGVTYVFKEIETLKVSGRESKLRVILTEGKNREIRNVFQFLNLPVVGLKRIRYGVYKLEDLKAGEIRPADFIGEDGSL